MKNTFAALAALALVAIALPANAEVSEGPWRVGEGYVVRTSALDLQQPDDRRQLLNAVERAAARLCKNAGPRVARRECATAAIDHAMARAPRAREAILLARTERDSVRIAQR